MTLRATHLRYTGEYSGNIGTGDTALKLTVKVGDDFGWAVAVLILGLVPGLVLAAYFFAEPKANSGHGKAPGSPRHPVGTRCCHRGQPRWHQDLRHLRPDVRIGVGLRNRRPDRRRGRWRGAGCGPEDGRRVARRPSGRRPPHVPNCTPRRACTVPPPTTTKGAGCPTRCTSAASRSGARSSVRSTWSARSSGRARTSSAPSGSASSRRTAGASRGAATRSAVATAACSTSSCSPRSGAWTSSSCTCAARSATA